MCGGIEQGIAAAIKAGAPQSVELIHGIEVGRRLLLTLTTGQEVDACQVKVKVKI